MAYCTNCGEKIADDANFCAKCGTKTAKGKAAKAVYPSDQLTDAFYTVGLELEKAFTLAARETHAALKRVSDDLQQKTRQTQTVACTKCNSQNAAGAVFCVSCGAKIAPTEESHGGV
ncbi:MAG: zinc-ribbon domain-containing protein [Candidatus Bathyarchaeia archaeon]